MKQQHTPGPWRYAPEFGAVLTDDKSGTIATLLPVGYSLDSEDIDKKQMTADGRLIAAAPELLEFVEGVAEGLNTGGNPGYLEDAVEFLEERAQRIIAKIEGDE